MGVFCTFTATFLEQNINIITVVIREKLKSFISIFYLFHLSIFQNKKDMKNQVVRKVTVIHLLLSLLSE